MRPGRIAAKVPIVSADAASHRVSIS